MAVSMLALLHTLGTLAGLACKYSCSFCILRLMVESMGSSVFMGTPLNSWLTRVLYVLRG
jgi:hypothetical protein